MSLLITSDVVRLIYSASSAKAAGAHGECADGKGELVRRYKITYSDHRVEMVEADSYKGLNYWFVFYRGDGIVTRVKAKDVRSISEIDESDPGGNSAAVPTFGGFA